MSDSPSVQILPDIGYDLDLESVLGETPPEECAHIVRRSGALGAGALIVAAAESGMEVEALCGYRWVPKGHAPDDLPACVRCVEVWQSLTSQ
ncbi:MAG TPA: DUF3039 domain-containing protein [Microthrixaceae bacterium]|nr:DUF3039 domain-containing protein [Microthrixaceae bacterium]HQF96604.1 DUF3039 domain-containing protein [Microthrixaceae bacterium]